MNPIKKSNENKHSIFDFGIFNQISSANSDNDIDIQSNINVSNGATSPHAHSSALNLPKLDSPIIDNDNMNNVPNNNGKHENNNDKSSSKHNNEKMKDVQSNNN